MRPSLRRLLGFLKGRKLFDTAHALEKETRVFFDLAHVERMIRCGRRGAADHYVSQFVTAGESRLSTELLRVRKLRILSKTVMCQKAWVPKYCNDNKAFFEAILKGGDASKLFMALDHAQASPFLRSESIRLKTVEMVKELVAQSPVLTGRKQLRRSRPRPSEVIPLGLRGCRWRQRKSVGRTPAPVLARLFLRKRLRSCQMRDRSEGPSDATSEPMVSATQVAPTTLLSATDADDPSVEQVGSPLVLNPEHMKTSALHPSSTSCRYELFGRLVTGKNRSFNQATDKDGGNG